MAAKATFSTQKQAIQKTPAQQIVEDIDASVKRNAKSGFRWHLGASIIGDECPRAVWYSWRWFTKRSFSGQMLRLFQRGHDEEPRMKALLQGIGLVVTDRDTNGEQFHISAHEGHFGGSGDGKISFAERYGLVGEGLWENKTIGSKYHRPLVKDGVKAAQEEHYKQMQTYMHKLRLPWALYTSTCKDNDELHFEVVEDDGHTGEQMVERAGDIIHSNAPPARIASSGADFRCKMCDHAKVCHYKARPEKNCRTCIHSEPREDKVWYCTNFQGRIPDQFTYKGCDRWEPYT